MTIITPNYPPPREPLIPRDKSVITDFVVHHSAGPKAQTPLEIDTFERSEGYAYMPYTWLINDAGQVFYGRPTTDVSAATYGRNLESVAVCMIGNFQRNDPGYNGPPSTAALAALEALCLQAHRGLPTIAQTYCHGDVADRFYAGDPNYATECCGDELRELVAGIKIRVAAALRH